MAHRARQLDRAVGEIEESILPALSRLLDGLLDTAALARPGADADQHADELRYAAFQVSALTELVESVAPLAQALEGPRRMSA